MKTSTKILCSVLALSSGTAVAFAQTESPIRPVAEADPAQGDPYESRAAVQGSADQQRVVSRSDEKFLQKAAQISMAEMKSAKLLSERATRPDVKSFANKLVSDHQNMSNELAQLAQQKHVSLPSTVDRDHQEEYTELATAKTEELDQEFLQQAVNTHEKTVELFKEASEDADDAEIRNFASKHLGTLAAHHETAKNLNKTVND